MAESRFKKLVSKLSQKPGLKNPAAVAASIGRKKYGAKVMKEAAASHISAASVAKKKK